MAEIRTIPHKIIIVTNQSGIGRGIIPLAVAEQINKQLVQIIEQANGRIDAVFMCPHTPTDHCQCRKPKPGLLQQAAQAHHIDLTHSIMIGDALTDIWAGQAANVHQTALLLTGRGREQAQQLEATQRASQQIYPNLSVALEALLKTKTR